MIGQKLADRYEIVSELGRGGMGVVYRAHDPLLDRDVAVKVIGPGMLTEEIAQRFQQEAKVVAQMDHPAIVSIFDFGHYEDSMFFVMPVLVGDGLQTLIRDRALRLGDILDVAIEVADALAYSHDRGVIHRDIKPENIMVAREEDGSLRVRVMDFGLARRSRVTALTKTGVLVGTASYVSPEQITGQPVDGRSDIYSLGTVMYHCITNDVPFTGELQSVVYRIVHEIPQSPRAIGAAIDEELEALILSCLEKELDPRPQSARELKQKLQAYRARVHSSDRAKSVTLARAVRIERPQSPFVDRTEEIKQLQQRLNLAIAGECQFVAVSGEPGVGKTRLLEELEGLAHARRIRVLHGRFVEQDAAFPYHGFCETIQDYFRGKETSSAPSRPPDLTDLGADLIGLFPMLSEIEAIRAGSGETSMPSPIVEPRSPGSKNQIFELLARTLARLARGAPLVLLLEDLHGADLSLEALPYIVRRLGPTPTLIIGTYRSTEVEQGHALNQVLEGFRGDRRFASIALGPLLPSDHRRFLGTLVGGSGIVDRLANRLYEASEGNPFFTKELLRTLLDSGGVTQDDRGHWNLSGETEIASDLLPATIQQAVETRIRRLPDERRAVLAVASVMGKSFDFRDLEKLAGERDDLDEAVDGFVKDGLVEEDRRSRGDRLTFSSGLVRDVLYAGLSRRKRRSLHRRYAEELERRHAGRLERVFPQLVHHYYEGDVPEKTVEFGLLQARKSLESFGADEAIRSARTALEFLDEDWDGERSAEAEARVLLARGHEMGGDVVNALEELESAIAAFRREELMGRAVETMLVAARAAWKARKTATARRWVERGMEAAQAEGADETHAGLLTLAATLATLRGEHGLAADYLGTAERLAPRAEDAGAQEEIPHGGTLIVGLSAPIEAPEPAAIQLVEEVEVYANVFETLAATNEDGNLIAALAASWEMRDEGRSFLFTLRPDVRFQDGKPLTAEDVKRSFEGSIRRVVPNLAPAFPSIQGFAEYAEGRAAQLSGLIVHADDRLEIRLDEPLPIFPTLLADLRTAVTFRPADDDAELVGSGPFRLAGREVGRMLLERSDDYWRGDPPKLDRIEFRLGMRAQEIGSALRAGELDLARDLQPQDLEEILRDPRWRSRVIEVAQKTTYFILFNVRSGPSCRSEALRRALSGVTRTRDLVWRTLGRFAQPASGYLPPGILGHDPGRRPRILSIEEGKQQLSEGGVPIPLRLKVAAHPLIADRYGQLLDRLFAAWSELGVEVELCTSDTRSYLEAWENNDEIDIWIGRWIPDFSDPDNFTHTLFRSGTGLLRAWFSSPETDEILDAARGERKPAVREELYAKFERHCLDRGVLVPLFQDVDYRVTGPRLRGVRLTATVPPVNYASLGKAEDATTEPRLRRRRGGVIRVPMTGRVELLDPALSNSVEQDEVIPSIYETLTRDVGDARIVPWLAESFSSAERGKRYRFRLRSDVSFHDGRKLTARDVRYSFERLLLTAGSEKRWQYAPIRGAIELLRGRTRHLAGFEIHSATEFSIGLEKPVSFFPGLLSFNAASIVPEGTSRIGDSWKSGAVGTGPFRVARFDASTGLELERNADYWRRGFPKSQGLSFRFAVSPDAILSGFRAGRFSLASDLFPADVEQLRKDPQFAAGYRETPRMSTYYAAFNIHRGPLHDPSVRRRIADALDVARIVQGTLGQVAIPAQGLIPPGMLGHEPIAESVHRRRAPIETAGEIELLASIHPVFTREYAGFFERFEKELDVAGFKLRQCEEPMAEILAARRQGEVDLALVQWVADYPDADSFVSVLQTDAGFMGPLCGSPELDRWIEKGRAETNPDLRHSAYRQVEETVMDENRLIPLFHEQVYRFARPEIEGLTISYWSPTVAYEQLRSREI